MGRAQRLFAFEVEIGQFESVEFNFSQALGAPQSNFLFIIEKKPHIFLSFFCACTPTHPCARSRAHAHKCTHTHSHTRECAHVHTHTQRHAHTLSPKHINLLFYSTWAVLKPPPLGMWTHVPQAHPTPSQRPAGGWPEGRLMDAPCNVCIRRDPSPLPDNAFEVAPFFKSNF